ncbi:ATP-binding cassette domain-containing protein [Inmirania thermothiophila]|uniref:Lipooligosaccharide transport system ATP-binding protein n=1 Tax=Inmirania thermothiophila TaxID=1750597 RepID=A0A3N1Y745_9GAMM|nr:ATP-binding cassette domain-containing protein [Inmirania thermothiophila]ROR34595.1 lipooligosaccharide transport system ATP-binding protein [Inmirania thermothiophila]
MDAVVRGEGLVKRFGTRCAVAGIDLAIPRGICFGILGPNGAGKTTTLRMILGLSVPDAGRLEVLGLPVPAQAREARRRIGVVSQADNLDPDFTVEENLRVYASYFGIGRAELARRLEGLIAFAELGERRATRIETLSGGMRRRLAIARALVNDPDLVVLDEPTTGLDPQARHLIWARLRELRRAGKTLLLTTHYMEEAERLCDALVVMDHGRILDQGSPAELVARHVPPEVVEIHGEAPRLGAVLEGLEGVEVERTGDAVYCYARDAGPLLARLRGEHDLVYLHRRAGLEDVFLRLTGRELRD